MSTPVPTPPARPRPLPAHIVEHAMLRDGTRVRIWSSGLVEVPLGNGVTRYLPATRRAALGAAARASMHTARSAFFAVHHRPYMVAVTVAAEYAFAGGFHGASRS